jgi:hypothetical protein
MQSRPIRRSGQPTCASASRMRAFDRDLIRGEHYGQRPLCAALTGRTHGCTDQPANMKKSLANSEPSTHGTKRTSRDVCLFVRFWGEADMPRRRLAYRSDATGPKSDISGRICCDAQQLLSFVVVRCGPRSERAPMRRREFIGLVGGAAIALAVGWARAASETFPS